MTRHSAFGSSGRAASFFVLALAAGLFGCDDETWEPSSLGGAGAPVRDEPPPVRGAAPTGTARMPSLPAAPTPEQEAQIARLVAEAGGEGGGGGRGEMPELLRPYDRFGENGEQLTDAQAADLLDRVLGAGRNVLGQEVTPCDRVMAMATAAASASGDEPLDPAEVQRLCGQVPPEVLACLQPEAEQSEADKRRCRNLFGQSSFLERTAPEDRNAIPRARSEADIRRLLGRPQEEAAPPAGPRDEPMRVD
jgi:hypothetical protein